MISDYVGGEWNGALTKTGPGTLILAGGAADQYNDYGDGLGVHGYTAIGGGALQADRDKGLSGWSGLILDGGVLQSDSAVTYAEPLFGNGGSTSRRVTWLSGGFSAGGGKMTVNIGGAATPQTILFGDPDGKHGIAGILKLSSNTAHFETELRNSLNLNGGSRMIQVDDNPSDSADFATISGAIAGTGSVTKTGSGTLYLRGAGNTYTGATTVTGGTVWLDKSSGAAIPENLNVNGDGTGNIYVRLNRDEQIADSAVVSLSNSPSGYSRLYLEGHTETVGGISCTNNRGIIQSGNLIISNSGAYSFAGYLRNSGGVNLTLEKQGAGTQTLSGAYITYTGGTAINGGKLILRDTADSSFCAAGITNNATLEFDAAATNVNYTGIISGSGALNKTGAFTLSLSGNNSYSGNTTISAGTLAARFERRIRRSRQPRLCWSLDRVAQSRQPDQSRQDHLVLDIQQFPVPQSAGPFVDRGRARFERLGRQ